MPGSTQYSMYPEVEDEVVIGSTPSDTLTGTTAGTAPAATTTPVSKASPFYQQKDFRTEKLAALKGLMSNRRANRMVDRYMKSDAGKKEEEAFLKSESDAYMASVDAYIQAGRARRDAMHQQALQQINKSVETPVPAPAPTATNTPTLRSRIDWLAEAKKYGFNSLDEVRKWQAANGLYVDGKFGKNSKAVWNRLQTSPRGVQRTPQQSTQQQYNPQTAQPGVSQPVEQEPAAEAETSPAAKFAAQYIVPAGSTPEQAVEHIKKFQAKAGMPVTGVWDDAALAEFQKIQRTKNQAAQQQQQRLGYTPRSFTLQDFNTHKNFRNPYHGHRTVAIDGKVYPVRVTTGLYGKYGIENDQMYAFDQATGMIRKVDENMIGFPSGQGFAKGSQWIHPSFFYEEQWLKHNPAPAKRGPLGGGLTKEYEDWLHNQYDPAFKAGFRKQGGTMNKINYFQQGGAAPQQDIKAQITALVQAAMQGDEKANQQVTQIMEAAKAGNQQAVQLAQMITEVAKQLQGQATAAKWGAKLNYIQSLKFAKGGKTCPACKKKVETKACGGKKAKKHQEGGWLELLPIYGTYQAGKRFYKNPSWRTAGEFGLNFLGDAAMLSGIGLGAKAAVTGLRAAALAGKVGKVGKTTMEGLKTARQFAKTQKTMGRMSEAAARNFVKTGAPVASPLPANFRVPEQVFRNVVDAGLKQDRIADTFIDATRAAKAATGAGAAGMVAKVGALE